MIVNFLEFTNSQEQLTSMDLGILIEDKPKKSTEYFCKFFFDKYFIGGGQLAPLVTRYRVALNRDD